MELTDRILSKTADGERISDKEWLRLFEEASLYDLGRCAHEIRMKRASGDTVTFILDRNINYTNICVSGCAFCAFFRKEEAEGGYTLSYGEIAGKVKEAKSLGATQVLLQGGLHPHLSLDYYRGMLRAIKECGDINVHGFSPPELFHISRNEGLSLRDTLVTLKEAGLDSIPGGGAEILDDRIRGMISPHKINAETWIRVMREAHSLGIPSTATMMFGTLEDKTHILNHLRLLRNLQDETGGFTAFIPWSFQSGNTALLQSPEFLGRKDLPGRGVPGYLRLLALSRLYLDNFSNIQASWVTMGVKVAQVSLHFGANDFGSLMIEENVVKAAGVHYRLDMNEIVSAISGAGFKAAVRNTGYSLLYYC